MAGLPSWRMVNLAPSPAMYTGECWGAWARASFIAPAIVRSVPSDLQVGQLISNATLSTLLIFHDRREPPSQPGKSELSWLKPPSTPDLTPHRERPPELDP